MFRTLALLLGCAVACALAPPAGAQDAASARTADPGNVRLERVVGPRQVVAGEPLRLSLEIRVDGLPADQLRIEIEQLENGASTFLAPELLGIDETPDGRQRVLVACVLAAPGRARLLLHAHAAEPDSDPTDDTLTWIVDVLPSRRIRVLYMDGSARWEQQYLSMALARAEDRFDLDTLLLYEETGDGAQPGFAPDWFSFESQDRLPREWIGQYDVFVLGDVDWRRFGRSEAAAREALRGLVAEVDAGAGLLLIAGTSAMPALYGGTDLEALLPIQLGTDPRFVRNEGAPPFAFRLQPGADALSWMDVASTPQTSRVLWEEAVEWQQYWCYPTPGIRAGTQLVASVVLPSASDGTAACSVIAHRPHGDGTVFWLGVDEIWRLRHEQADRYYYPFYAGVLTALARQRLESAPASPALRAVRPLTGAGQPMELRLGGDTLRPPVPVNATLRHVESGQEWTVALDRFDADPELRARFAPELRGVYEVRTDTVPPAVTTFEVVDTTTTRASGATRRDPAPGDSADDNQDGTEPADGRSDPVGSPLTWLLVLLAAGTVATVYVLRRRAA